MPYAVAFSIFWKLGDAIIRYFWAQILKSDPKRLLIPRLLEKLAGVRRHPQLVALFSSLSAICAYVLCCVVCSYTQLGPLLRHLYPIIRYRGPVSPRDAFYCNMKIADRSHTRRRSVFDGRPSMREAVQPTTLTTNEGARPCMSLEGTAMSMSMEKICTF